MDSTQDLGFSSMWPADQSAVMPPARPTPEQPGSLLEQFQVIAYYLADPDPDRERARQRARRVVLHHARKGPT